MESGGRRTKPKAAKGRRNESVNKNGIMSAAPQKPEAAKGRRNESVNKNGIMSAAPQKPEAAPPADAAREGRSPKPRREG